MAKEPTPEGALLVLVLLLIVVIFLGSVFALAWIFVLSLLIGVMV